MIRRSKGVVLAYDSASESVVRIEDEYDLRNGLELPIASIHENITLAQGVLVDFIVAATSRNGEPAKEAIDVRPVSIALTGEPKNEKEDREETILWSLAKKTSEEFDDGIPEGRGGPKHRYIQQFIKITAIERGWGAVIEQQPPNSTNWVDVTVTKGDVTIACEVSISNTPSAEAKAVKERIGQGFNYVVVLADTRRKLRKIKKAVSLVVKEKGVCPIHFLLPEEFLSFLDLVEPNISVQEKVVRGYKVKTRYVLVSSKRRENIERTVATILLQSVAREKATKEGESKDEGT